jgi:glutamate-1-semialdehyde aminotransferase
MSGIGACLLGFGDPDVTEACVDRIRRGSTCTLNPPEEVELAAMLCEIHPWAEQVRYARTGGEIAAVAVRIARATTERDVVVVAGYHGWHDWYLAANLVEADALEGLLLPGLEPAGVPRALRGTTLAVSHGDLEGLSRCVEENPDRVAAVVMEPVRHRDPPPEYLAGVRKICDRAGALLIFDEITIGWRLNYGGSHLRYGVVPDLAIFGKTLGNGHPMAAVIGTKQAMEGAHRSFISSSYWTEGVGPAAAVAAVRKMKAVEAAARVAETGRRIQQIWRRAAERASLAIEVSDDFPCLARFAFAHEKQQELKTLFTQEMLQHGFLATPAVSPTVAHLDSHLEDYERAVTSVYATLAEAVGKGEIEGRLRGPVAHSTFARLID